jgi:hypothetical protein
MSSSKVTPKYVADHIRRVLKDGGSAPHSEDVQHFFKEEIKSRGWYAAASLVKKEWISWCASPTIFLQEEFWKRK